MDDLKKGVDTAECNADGVVADDAIYPTPRIGAMEDANGVAYRIAKNDSVAQRCTYSVVALRSTTRVALGTAKTYAQIANLLGIAATRLAQLGNLEGKEADRSRRLASRSAVEFNIGEKSELVALETEVFVIEVADSIEREERKEHQNKEKNKCKTSHKRV